MCVQMRMLLLRLKDGDCPFERINYLTKLTIKILLLEQFQF